MDEINYKKENLMSFQRVGQSFNLGEQVLVSRLSLESLCNLFVFLLSFTSGHVDGPHHSSGQSEY